MQRANESHCSTPVHFTHVLLRCHRLSQSKFGTVRSRRRRAALSCAFGYIRRLSCEASIPSIRSCPLNAFFLARLKLMH